MDLLSFKDLSNQAILIFYFLNSGPLNHHYKNGLELDNE